MKKNKKTRKSNKLKSNKFKIKVNNYSSEATISYIFKNNNRDKAILKALKKAPVNLGTKELSIYMVYLYKTLTNKPYYTFKKENYTYSQQELSNFIFNNIGSFNKLAVSATLSFFYKSKLKWADLNNIKEGLGDKIITSINSNIKELDSCGISLVLLSLSYMDINQENNKDICKKFNKLLGLAQEKYKNGDLKKDVISCFQIYKSLLLFFGSGKNFDENLQKFAGLEIIIQNHLRKTCQPSDMQTTVFNCLSSVLKQNGISDCSIKSEVIFKCFSFDILLDLNQEGNNYKIIVDVLGPTHYSYGGLDEQTSSSHSILERFGYYIVKVEHDKWVKKINDKEKKEYLIDLVEKSIGRKLIGINEDTKENKLEININSSNIHIKDINDNKSKAIKLNRNYINNYIKEDIFAINDENKLQLNVNSSIVIPVNDIQKHKTIQFDRYYYLKNKNIGKYDNTYVSDIKKDKSSKDIFSENNKIEKIELDNEVDTQILEQVVVEIEKKKEERKIDRDYHLKILPIFKKNIENIENELNYFCEKNNEKLNSNYTPMFDKNIENMVQNKNKEKRKLDRKYHLRDNEVIELYTTKKNEKRKINREYHLKDIDAYENILKNIKEDKKRKIDNISDESNKFTKKRKLNRNYTKPEFV